MVTTYTVLKFLHVVSVIAWVGGGVMVQTLGFRALGAEPERVVRFAEDAAWAGNHFFMPASFATLIFGLGLVPAGHYGWSDLWIILGLVGFALTAINGSAVLGRTSKKLHELAGQRGPNDPVVQYTARRLLRILRIDLVVLVLVVLDMVIKPGT
jgi:uncharacterized membrane protein